MNDAKSEKRTTPPCPTKDTGSAVPAKSRFEKFASTQAAGDGIEGDALKRGKTVDEKLGANMADRK
jgi:hypothetical protein